MRRLLLLSCCLALLSGCAGVPAPLEPQAAARTQAQQEILDGLRRKAPEASLDAADAGALALGSNLNLRIAALQRLLADTDVNLADLQKLPQLLLRSGYTRRSHLESGDTDPLNRRNSSQEISWDVLGFANAYVRAAAASDQTLLEALNTRDEANRVLLEARLAWQTVAHQDARETVLAAAEERIRQAVALLGRLRNTTLVDPNVLALRETELWQQQSRLRSARLEAQAARWRLASLLAVADGDRLRVAAEDEGSREAEFALMDKFLALPQETLEAQALARRTDLMKTDVQVRLLRHEAHAVWLSALPGITLRRGRYLDTDIAKDPPWWTESGYSLSFNLFSLLSVFEQHRQIGLQQNLLQLKQLALAVGVVEQVRIARERLETQRALWQDALTRLQLAENRYRLWQRRIPFNPDDEFSRAAAAAAHADALINADQAYEAALRASWQLMQAVGLDFAPPADIAAPGADHEPARLRAWWASLPGRLAAAQGPEEQL